MPAVQHAESLIPALLSAASAAAPDLQNLPDRLAGWEGTFRVDYEEALRDAEARTTAVKRP